MAMHSLYTLFLIVLIELVTAVGALVEDSGAFVHAADLHGVEQQLWVETLRARLLDGGMLPHDFIFLVCVDPRRAWSRS